MPDKPRADNPNRNVRVDDSLWLRAKVRAVQEGKTVSDVMRRALEQYLKT